MEIAKSLYKTLHTDFCELLNELYKIYGTVWEIFLLKKVSSKGVPKD